MQALIDYKNNKPRHIHIPIVKLTAASWKMLSCDSIT